MFKKPSRIAMLAVLIAATVGLLASFVLSHEALVLAENADAVLECNINAVVNCAAVANHWSATLFGVPNSFFGMIALPVVMTIAVITMVGVKLPKWFMRVTQLGVIGGFIFAAWMFYMSYSVIGILCPWCLTLDVAMIVVFFGVTRYNILENTFSLKQTTNQKLQNFVKKGYDQLAMYLLLVLMIVAIILKFGSELFA